MLVSELFIQHITQLFKLLELVAFDHLRRTVVHLGGKLPDIPDGAEDKLLGQKKKNQHNG